MIGLGPLGCWSDLIDTITAIHAATITPPFTRNNQPPNHSKSIIPGAGIPEFFTAVNAAAAEFEAEYLPELLRQKAKREAEEKGRQEKEMERLMGDLRVGGGGKETAGVEAGGGGGRGV